MLAKLHLTKKSADNQSTRIFSWNCFETFFRFSLNLGGEDRCRLARRRSNLRNRPLAYHERNCDVVCGDDHHSRAGALLPLPTAQGRSSPICGAFELLRLRLAHVQAAPMPLVCTRGRAQFLAAEFLIKDFNARNIRQRSLSFCKRLKRFKAPLRFVHPSSSTSKSA